MPDLVAMASARNDFLFAHDCAVVGMLANLFSAHPEPLESFKPGREVTRKPRRKVERKG